VKKRGRGGRRGSGDSRRAELLRGKGGRRRGGGMIKGEVWVRGVNGGEESRGGGGGVGCNGGGVGDE